MSEATKRKYVFQEVLESFDLPTELQTIVKVMESRGNNLHQVVDKNGEIFLVSMPNKFRRKIWIKKNNYVLVEPISEGVKVKAEIVKILTQDHIKWYKKQNCWPTEFDESKNNEFKDTKNSTNKSIKNCDNDDDSDDSDNDDDLFVNTNRLASVVDEEDSESESSSDESDCS